MAAQKRKTSSQDKRGTTKKSNSSGKKTTGKTNHKESHGPDLLTIVIVLIAVVLVAVLLSKYTKEKEGTETLKPTGSVSVTGTKAPDDPTKGPAETTPTQTPAPPQAVTKAPTPAPTAAPTSAPDSILSLEQAKKQVEKIVELEKYSIELLDDHLMIDGAEYYTFCINDENGASLEPLLIVEKREGTVLCYDMSGVVSMVEKFPLDKTETGTGGAKSLTPEEAKAVLAGYTKTALGLTKEPSDYEMTVDDWTTMADGRICYGINLFETTDGKQRFRGTFYVATDGSAVYSKDDVTGEFIKR